MKIEFYETVSGETTISLDQLVNQRISDGWQPHGSPYTNHNGTLFQAMVLDTEAVEKTKKETQAEITGLLSKPGAKLTRLSSV
jgi:hypothetical protein